MQRTFLVTVTILAFAMYDVATAQDSSKDPLQPVKEAKRNVDETEAHVLRSLEAIEKLTKQHRFDDWKSEKLIINEFRTKLIPSLKKAASDLLTGKAEFDKRFKLYQAAVRKAPAAFEAAAKQFEQYADQEDDATLKEHYLDMELHAKKWSKEMEERHSRLDGMYKEVTDKTKFVEKSLVFLDRLDGFLAIAPDPDNAAEVQQYLTRLNNYIDQLRRSIDSFKGFSKSLDDPSRQSPGSQEPRRAPGVTSTSSSPQHLAHEVRTESLNRLVTASPEPGSDLDGRVTLTSDKRYHFGTWFEITFDREVVLAKGDFVTLYRPNGESFSVSVIESKYRQVVAVTQSHQPKEGDHLSIRRSRPSSSSALVARR